MRELVSHRHFYDAFPFLKFFRIMEDESKLKEHNVSEEDWEAIKTRWVNTHEDLSTDGYFKSKRDEFKMRNRYNKLLFLKQRAGVSQKGLKELYEQIGFKWHEDQTQREKYLEQQLLKSKRTQQIYDGQRGTLEKQKVEELAKEKKFGLEEAHECIASLELAGASIPDYEKLTLGKYDALNSVIQKRNKNG